MSAEVRFRCPRTGRRVQARLDGPFDHETYIAMQCAACDSVHRVNPSDGTLYEEDQEDE